MEDFFDGSFESTTSTSRNEDMYFDMDKILYGSKANSAPETSRQQKAKTRIPDKDKHKAQVESKKKKLKTTEQEQDNAEDQKFVISDDDLFDDY